jgi:hypothetical protein
VHADFTLAVDTVRAPSTLAIIRVLIAMVIIIGVLIAMALIAMGIITVWIIAAMHGPVDSHPGLIMHRTTQAMVSPMRSFFHRQNRHTG